MGTRSRSVEIRGRVGYLSGELALGELALYEHLTGRELLDYIANLRGLRDRARRPAVPAPGTRPGPPRPGPVPGKQAEARPSAAGAPPDRPRGHGRGADGVPVLPCPVRGRAHGRPGGDHPRWSARRPAEVGTLKTHALRRFELDFARPVPAAVFERLPAWSRW